MNIFGANFLSNYFGLHDNNWNIVHLIWQLSTDGDGLFCLNGDNFKFYPHFLASKECFHPFWDKFLCYLFLIWKFSWKIRSKRRDTISVFVYHLNAQILKLYDSYMLQIACCLSCSHKENVYISNFSIEVCFHFTK